MGLKKAGEGLSDRLVQGTVKFGGGSLMMWGCMSWDGVGYSCKIDVGWMLSSILKFWRMSFRIAWSDGEKVLLISSFNRTMIPNTLVNWPNPG